VTGVGLCNVLWNWIRVLLAGHTPCGYGVHGWYSRANLLYPGDASRVVEGSSYVGVMGYFFLRAHLRTHRISLLHRC